MDEPACNEQQTTPSEVHARNFAWSPVVPTSFYRISNRVFVCPHKKLIYYNLFCVRRIELVYTIFGAFVVVNVKVLICNQGVLFFLYLFVAFLVHCRLFSLIAKFDDGTV